MNTAFILMAQYGATVVIPIESVCRDYFSHLSPENPTRKISAGDLDLPLVRMDDGHKCAKGVALVDLAAYLDRRMEAARKECRQFCG
ncbi:Pyocin activator protein PrtN [Methylobacterium sp. WL12]|uniref:pyocin activator PrtN family protein n=1 Tax=Methylobacterium sp. WL12 TaxID=2603890 RepID=UPI0011CA0618|nr:pyocin activator PrtN family protein [Methylobacterium sp. WL12]TXM71369.1 Pyocin activator protein PrtN [Methylobacterium sp. WL12]